MPPRSHSFQCVYFHGMDQMGVILDRLLADLETFAKNREQCLGPEVNLLKR